MVGACCGRRRSWSEFATTCKRKEWKEVTTREGEFEDKVK